MNKTAVVVLYIPAKNIVKDVEVPINISADRVLSAICKAYQLREEGAVLVCEDPIALIQGKKTLGEFGVHQGSRIRYIAK